MRFRSTVLFSAVVLSIALPAFCSPHTRRGPTSQRFSSKKSAGKAKTVSQRGIDADRATQIQTALISHGYMTGTPTGTWNPETQEALRKLQADNGWQTKMVPDSRAIIKLGLGPNSPTAESATLASTPVPNAPEAEPSLPAQQ